MAVLHDVAIVGAGPVGATLALALADADLDVVVLDARAAGETLRGDRSLALSHGTRLILERLDVWRDLAADAGAVTPITTIDISQAGGFGRATLDAAAQGVPALGYVVSYRALQAALDRALARTRTPVRYGVRVGRVDGATERATIAVDGGEPVAARLAAVADGTGAAVGGIARRRHEYGQHALVAKLWRAAAPRGVAYERFTPDGPVALLPEDDHYGLVWTASPARAAELAATGDAAFLTALARHFGAAAGRFDRVADRRTFPLALEYVHDPAGARSVVLGNAAQTLHPVAGQGFNVGLRDAWQLGMIIVDAPAAAIGTPAMLARYARARRPDRMAGIAFTHGLVGIFGIDLALARWPRGVALAALDALPPVKRAFTRAMLFGLR